MMRVVLFDDERARDWMPFALTRPVGELLFGAYTFRERATRLFGSCAGHLTAEDLAGFEEPGAAPVIARANAASSSPTLFLSARAVVDWDVRFDPGRPGVIRVGGAVAGCFLTTGSPPAEFFERPFEFQRVTDDGGPSFSRGDARGAHGYDLPGVILENVWDLIALNDQQIKKDFEAARSRTSPSKLPAGVHVLGDPEGRIRLGTNVTIEPGVLLDVSSGPIWLDDNVTVRALSRVQGPVFVAEDSTLLGGPYTAVSIGPVCKIHGEIEESIVLGYSNKAHDGFLGHAYLGRWVNLGALTTNSDLKNNYGTIRLWTPRGDIDTGQIKIGCFLGDHVKTGIGVMLNTGTVVGAGSNIFGAVQPPKYVPPFRWGSGDSLVDYDLDRFLDTAKTVMARRKIVLGDGQASVLRRAWQRARATGEAPA
jgi:UDP-N-acetylglucosamine diphosphorylase/glucosamine-1-phosphate N-acetyltransferase